MSLQWSIPALVLLTAAAVQPVDEKAPRPADDSAAISGLRVVMDPATGEVVSRPTADDLRRLGTPAGAVRRSADELEQFELPSGARGVVLDGWADHATRLERGPDGALRLVCSQGDRHGQVR